jgi:hypothetical protein
MATGPQLACTLGYVPHCAGQGTRQPPNSIGRSTMNCIAVDHLVERFGEITAVDDISFTEECFVLLFGACRDRRRG